MEHDAPLRLAGVTVQHLVVRHLQIGLAALSGLQVPPGDGSKDFHDLMAAGELPDAGHQKRQELACSPASLALLEQPQLPREPPLLEDVPALAWAEPDCARLLCL